MPETPIHTRLELTFTSSHSYENPLQDAELTALFTSPTGKQRRIVGFWDGDSTWRLRFTPDEQGEWQYMTTCTDPTNNGLHHQQGTFTSTLPNGETRFTKHGRLRLSDNRRHFVHHDGAPFFWMGDTVWNGPLRSTESDWQHYLNVRTQQGFTAAQIVVTQYLAAPDGDIDGQLPYSGSERITLNLPFFQRLDHYIDALAAADILAVPTLLWGADWSSPEVNAANPGYTLPEDQAIKLARYMVARWDANPVAWFLPGDAPNQGRHALRWKHIGRGVFGDISHAPVTLHPIQFQWFRPEFEDETWLDYLGYQSGHGDDEPTIAWLVDGAPAHDWRNGRARPILNFEPPYEDHIAYQSQQPFDAHKVRRALYWSLLNTPIAGVTYGGHGVWGWDEGGTPPAGHPLTGRAKAWREALHLPAAEQICHLVGLFNSLAWWNFQPRQDILIHQPGNQDMNRWIAAAYSKQDNQWLIYTPVAQTIALDDLRVLSHDATWFNPRTGARTAAQSDVAGAMRRFTPPDEGDWLLLISGYGEAN